LNNPEGAKGARKRAPFYPGKDRLDSRVTATWANKRDTQYHQKQC